MNQDTQTDKTEKLFDAIAGDYDRLNHLLSLGIDRLWRRRALRHTVDRQHPQHILDLACGTGDFSIAMAQHAHPGTRICGVDISEGMLEVMRRKVAAKGLTGCVSAEQGSSDALRFADNTFDCVTIAFGIRNFTRREQAIREILRVLRPGGRLVILELSMPEWPPLRWLYNLYFSHVLPVIGGAVSGEKGAYRYLPASVLQFPKKKEWMQTMTSCGCIHVTHHAYSLGICRLYTGEKEGA